MLLRALVLFAAVARSGDGVPIDYTVEGRGEPALVFVHCWNCDRHFWDAQLRAFRRSHRVVAIDLAGHGQSGTGRKDWTIEAFGDDVKAVVDKLGLKRVVLVGSSMGGPVALEAARKLGDRVVGIVAVDTLQNVEQKAPPEQVDKLLQEMTADYKGQTTKFIGENLFSPTTPPAVRKRVLTVATSASPDRSVAMLRAAMLFNATTVSVCGSKWTTRPTRAAMLARWTRAAERCPARTSALGAVAAPRTQSRKFWWWAARSAGPVRSARFLFLVGAFSSSCTSSSAACPRPTTRPPSRAGGCGWPGSSPR